MQEITELMEENEDYFLINIHCESELRYRNVCNKLGLKPTVERQEKSRLVVTEANTAGYKLLVQFDAGPPQERGRRGRERV